MADLSKLSRKIGYQFNNAHLLTQALTHRSHSGLNNERLEFLGDAILNFVIASALYEKFERVEEGELSRFRAMLVKGETLTEVAQDFGLGDYLRLGSGELKSGGFRRPSILADTVEALIGAIYLDSDMQQCQALIRQWFAERLKNIEHTAENKDPKTALQEFLQGQKLPLPHYELISAEGAEHEQTFIVECQVEGLTYNARGHGNNRRKAEQMAAEKFLNYLKSSL